MPFYVIIGLGLLVIVISINWYLLKRKQKEDALLNRIKHAEMETLRSQMNPHFMFNTLNSINSYIVQNKTKDASKYLTSFSKLMRNILENSKHSYISLAKEIQTLKLYIDLELVRLEHFFKYQIIVDDAIDTDQFLVPPLVIQPFVENAIWHGLKDRNTNAKITIKFNKIDENYIEIIVEDNGIGREKSAQLKTNKTSHKSFGVEITIDRLKMINPENSVQIIDLYDSNNNASGTKVVLTLKVNNHD